MPYSYKTFQYDLRTSAPICPIENKVCDALFLVCFLRVRVQILARLY